MKNELFFILYTHNKRILLGKEKELLFFDDIIYILCSATTMKLASNLSKNVCKQKLQKSLKHLNVYVDMN